MAFNSAVHGWGLDFALTKCIEVKMDIEYLITRLKEETIARKYFATKVKDLQMELETRRQSSKAMQCDIEELQRKCMELDLRLTIEQDARMYAESVEETTIKENELLMKELDDIKEIVEILRKEKEEMELKSKSDVKEVKACRTSDNLTVDACASHSDTIDVLETADTQIGLLLAQLKFLVKTRVAYIFGPSKFSLANSKRANGQGKD